MTHTPPTNQSFIEQFNPEEFVRTLPELRGGGETHLSFQETELTNDPEEVAFIGIGGTISSGYSPRLETIIPGFHKAGFVIAQNFQKLLINQQKIAGLDLFAKDSRDINAEDISYFLNFIKSLPHTRILVTCGTYFLPKITEALFYLMQGRGKHIGVTGATLPSGFTYSDADANVMSTLTLLNFLHANPAYNKGHVFANFHGEVYDTLDRIKKINLHPAAADSVILQYPHKEIPTEK